MTATTSSPSLGRWQHASDTLKTIALQGLSEPKRSDLKRRCTDRAVAALSRALDKGFTDLFDLNANVDMDPIRGDPGFQALVLRLKKRQTP